MKVSYGSPGHKGVTTLMAVGADELGESSTEEAVRIGSWGALAVAILGSVTGEETLAKAGAGAAAALFAIRLIAGRNDTVVVTAPPAPTAGLWW
jgi:voltage-gated potassium channel Kch